MKTTQVYKVSTTVDEFDRTGTLIGYFGSEKGAEKAAAGRGWYGGKGKIEPMQSITVDGETYVLANYGMPVIVDRHIEEYNAALKASGLSKLSKEEKLALGLK